MYKKELIPTFKNLGEYLDRAFVEICAGKIN